MNNIDLFGAPLSGIYTPEFQVSHPQTPAQPGPFIDPTPSRELPYLDSTLLRQINLVASAVVEGPSSGQNHYVSVWAATQLFEVLKQKA